MGIKVIVDGKSYTAKQYMDHFGRIRMQKLNEALHNVPDHKFDKLYKKYQKYNDQMSREDIAYVEERLGQHD